MIISSPLSPPSKPRSPRNHSSKHSSGVEHRQQLSASVPSSPTLQSPNLRRANMAPSSKSMAASGTFLADSPSIDQVNDSEDVEDPHDLSFSSNHILRASMVDNLVMSLDQFSSEPFDDTPYTPRNNSYDTGTRVRKRGHTFSSSVSSENDMHDLRALPPFPETMHRMPPPVRNNVRYQKNVQKLPSIFGEDEDSVRAKGYDAQRAPQPGHARRRKNTSTGGRSNDSSTSSSIDLGHLASLSGRLGGPGDRRSRSFDFGSRQRNVLISKPPVGADGAPTPVIFSGPEAQSGIPTSLSASPLVRKNSTKSSKSTYAKKGRAVALGTTTMRANNDSIPQLPSMKSQPSLNTTSQEQKSNMGSHHEPVVISRPGFFRRVFGSSRTLPANPESHSHTPNTLTKAQYGRSTPVQDETLHPTTPPAKMQKAVRRTSTDASANKENQPVITKKSSAFFRRRKKSISNTVLPPLPLILNAELRTEPEPVDGTSPVSSLRAFMDPYLGENPVTSAGHGHTRTGSMQGFYAPNLPPPAFSLPKESGTQPKVGGHTRNQSHGSNKTLRSNAKAPSTLRIPHQDSFLADSSSADEPFRRSPLDGGLPPHPERPNLKYRRSVNDLRLVNTASAGTLPSPVFDPRAATTRQGSWQSEKNSPASLVMANPLQSSASMDHVNKPVTRRQNTLEVTRKGSKGSPFTSTSDVSEYRSPPSTPLIIETPDGGIAGSASSPDPLSNASQNRLQDTTDKHRAQQILDNADEEIDSSSAGAWLGEAGAERERVRKAYMELFDWSEQNILDALRGLCDRIALKGETQQMDRIMDAFARRWCECNPSHTFKSSG